ncbi:MAG: hypothetical protein WAM39_09840 [Bryobacteraceae bacterium]
MVFKVNKPELEVPVRVAWLEFYGLLKFIGSFSRIARLIPRESEKIMKLCVLRLEVPYRLESI